MGAPGRSRRTGGQPTVALSWDGVAHPQPGPSGPSASADARSPDDALDALIAAHVDFALRDRSIIAVYDQEAHALPDDDRRRIRRTQRAYAETWADVLRARTPELTPEVARAAVHAAFGLVNSVSDYRTELADDDLRAVLVSMTRAALDAPPT